MALKYNPSSFSSTVSEDENDSNGILSALSSGTSFSVASSKSKWSFFSVQNMTRIASVDSSAIMSKFTSDGEESSSDESGDDEMTTTPLADRFDTIFRYPSNDDSSEEESQGRSANTEEQYSKESMKRVGSWAIPLLSIFGLAPEQSEGLAKTTPSGLEVTYADSRASSILRTRSIMSFIGFSTSRKVYHTEEEQPEERKRTASSDKEQKKKKKKETRWWENTLLLCGLALSALIMIIVGIVISLKPQPAPSVFLDFNGTNSTLPPTLIPTPPTTVQPTSTITEVVNRPPTPNPSEAPTRLISPSPTTSYPTVHPTTSPPTTLPPITSSPTISSPTTIPPTSTPQTLSDSPLAASPPTRPPQTILTPTIRPQTSSDSLFDVAWSPSTIASPPRVPPPPQNSAPSSMPTLARSFAVARECEECSDTPNSYMQDMNEECSPENLLIQRKCNKNEVWRENKFCQATCYHTGFGYEGDLCC